MLVYTIMGTTSTRSLGQGNIFMSDTSIHFYTIDVLYFLPYIMFLNYINFMII